MNERCKLIAICLLAGLPFWFLAFQHFQQFDFPLGTHDAIFHYSKAVGDPEIYSRYYPDSTERFWEYYHAYPPLLYLLLSIPVYFFSSALVIDLFVYLLLFLALPAAIYQYNKNKWAVYVYLAGSAITQGFIVSSTWAQALFAFFFLLFLFYEHIIAKSVAFVLALLSHNKAWLYLLAYSLGASALGFVRPEYAMVLLGGNAERIAALITSLIIIFPLPIAWLAFKKSFNERRLAWAALIPLIAFIFFIPDPRILLQSFILLCIPAGDYLKETKDKRFKLLVVLFMVLFYAFSWLLAKQLLLVETEIILNTLSIQ